MNISGIAAIATNLNATEAVLMPYSVSPIDASMFLLHTPTALRATSQCTESYFITNMTDSGSSEVKVHRLGSKGSFPMERRGPHGSLDDSALQAVSKHISDKVSFIFAMILIPCFSVFGSLGNVLSLRVLVHHRMRSSTNMVLAALSVSDLMFLFHALYFSCLRLYSLRNPAAGDKLRSMTFPVLGAYGSVVTARITTGLTTMLGIERLVAVYFPMKAKAMFGKVMTLTCITTIYLVTAMAFIPNALKYHSYPTTINNKTVYILGRTELGKNDLFYLIYGNILNILFRFLPLLILTLVNILIALAIRRTWSFRKTISSGGCVSYEQNRITMMLLMVSLVFIVCILPGAIHSILDQIYKQYSSTGHQSNLYNVVRSVTYFLETINSSVNFIIYMAFSTKFCRTYKQIFCCSSQRSQPQPPGSIRSIIRFSFRPQNGSRSSITSYRELYFLNQLGKGKSPNMNEAENNGKAISKNRFATNSNTIPEESGKRTYRSKYSSSDSYSCHSHSGHSHSGHSHSHSGHSHSHSGSQGNGERFSDHSVHSSHSVHSNHNMEATAEEMYS